jgi:hypothetical protein
VKKAVLTLQMKTMKKNFAYQSYDIDIAGIPYKNASLAPATVPE